MKRKAIFLLIIILIAIASLALTITLAVLLRPSSTYFKPKTSDRDKIKFGQFSKLELEINSFYFNKKFNITVLIL